MPATNPVHLKQHGESRWTACGRVVATLKTGDILVANCVPCLESRRDHYAGMLAATEKALEFARTDPA